MASNTGLAKHTFISATGEIVYLDTPALLHRGSGSLYADTELNFRSRFSSCCEGCMANVYNVSFVFWSFFILFISTGTICFFSFHYLFLFLFVLAGWFIGLTLHEFSHALIAHFGGDTTVKQKGYLTLNVFLYVDIIMSILVPSAILILGGFPLPGGSVNIETSSLKNRWWKTFVAIGGPLANLFIGLFACVSYCLIHFFNEDKINTILLSYAFALLAFFMFFIFVINLIPLPPLDGWNAVECWLPENFFLKRWMKNHWRAKTVCIATLALLFILCYSTEIISNMSIWLGSLFGVPAYSIENGYQYFFAVTKFFNKK